MSYTITSLVKKPYFEFFGQEQMLVAHIVDGDGTEIGVSRRESDSDQTAWLVDSIFSSNGMPIKCHGKGDRSCLKASVTTQVAADLNARAEALSLSF